MQKIWALCIFFTCGNCQRERDIKKRLFQTIHLFIYSQTLMAMILRNMIFLLQELSSNNISGPECNIFQLKHFVKLQNIVVILQNFKMFYQKDKTSVIHSTFYCSLQQSGGSALNRSTISSGPSGRSYNDLKSFASLFQKNSWTHKSTSLNFSLHETLRNNVMFYFFLALN